MKLLKQNITNIFGKEGKAWIDDLPTTINTLTTYGGLKQITPVENMTFNYVAKAVTNADQAVVLKIGCMDSYVDTMKKLHNKPLPKTNNYRHIRDWLSAIDNLADQVCPPHLTKKAIKLKNELLASISNEVFLHGDLHHDNILKNDDHWLAIDPKGIIGDAEFEVAAFDFMYVNELANKNNQC